MLFKGNRSSDKDVEMWISSMTMSMRFVQCWFLDVLMVPEECNNNFTWTAFFLHSYSALMNSGVDWIGFRSRWTNGDVRCQVKFQKVLIWLFLSVVDGPFFCFFGFLFLCNKYLEKYSICCIYKNSFQVYFLSTLTPPLSYALSPFLISWGTVLGLTLLSYHWGLEITHFLKIKSNDPRDIWCCALVIRQYFLDLICVGWNELHLFLFPSVVAGNLDLTGQKQVFKAENNPWVTPIADQFQLGVSHVFEYIRSETYK